MNRRYLFRLLASVGLGGVAAVQATAQGRGQAYAEHLAWVSDVLRKMQEIRPGMSRERLLTVFTTEGGLSTGLQRTYVSQECPYFKVSVEFQPVGRPNRDNTGRVTLVEDRRDTIITISRPYLEFGIMD
jgi:hypothetical protein